MGEVALMTRIAGSGVQAVSIIGSALLAKTLVKPRTNKAILMLIFAHIRVLRVFAKRANRCLATFWQHNLKDYHEIGAHNP